MDLKTKKQRNRTKKEFTDYNDYRDRPFGLKWGTAFAIDELNKVIIENEKNSLKENKKLPQMSREEIDEVLQYAFLKSKPISIQVNKYNDLGFIADSIVGKFEGFEDTDYIYINQIRIGWSIIRNVRIKEDDKWE